MDGVKFGGFINSLDDLISRWYEWRFGKKRTEKFLDDSQLQIFISDMYDYTYYCFSKSDQAAMSEKRLADRDVEDEMHKKNHKLRQPTLTLMQGGKKDDSDGTLN
jgi:hypothetical protein